MPRLGASSFSFPAFSGATRLLVLVNLAAFFVLLLAGALIMLTMTRRPVGAAMST